MNQTSLHEGSLEITLTVPLNQFLYNMLNAHDSPIYTIICKKDILKEINSVYFFPFSPFKLENSDVLIMFS